MRFDVGMNKGFYYRRLQGRRLQHRHRISRQAISATARTVKGGYFPVPPVDCEQDMRGEMLAVMGDMGIQPEKHHHEVAARAA